MNIVPIRQTENLRGITEFSKGMVVYCGPRATYLVISKEVYDLNGTKVVDVWDLDDNKILPRNIKLMGHMVTQFYGEV